MRRALGEESRRSDGENGSLRRTCQWLFKGLEVEAASSRSNLPEEERVLMDIVELPIDVIERPTSNPNEMDEGMRHRLHRSIRRFGYR